MTALVWFKRDLRVHDHAALVRAAEAGPVLPLYIAEPEYWGLDDTSHRQWQFTAECLHSLREALGALGQPLVVRVGPAVKVLGQLCSEFSIRSMFSHEETGNAWTFARARAVADWARQAGISWTELPQSAVVRRLDSRDGWAARRSRWMAKTPLPAPAGLNPLKIDPGRIPEARELLLDPDGCAQRQTGGRERGLQLLDSFLAERGHGYRVAMSSPTAGQTACSRISPYLALGAISVREAVHALNARRQSVLDKQWRQSLKSFASRLAWRDHFMQKLEDQPSLEVRCLHPATEGLRQQGAWPERLQAWQAGQTGLPFVDACMRYLSATGWLNFRMRAMLMAVASYHLWLDWRDSGPHLARLFTDYEPGIHWSQCQMQSGTTGINTIRIYNPIKQGMDQDPDGAFIRRWIPELAPIPDSFVHQPWLWPAFRRQSSYPSPIVDVAAAGREARERVWALRKASGFDTEARKVAHRHASRRDRQGHFIRDEIGTRPKPDNGDGSRQLTLDL